MISFIRCALAIFMLALSAPVSAAENSASQSVHAVLDLVANSALRVGQETAERPQDIRLSSIAQGQMRSLGIGDGRFSLLRTEFLDEEAIPAGRIIVGVAVYEEQSGRRIHLLLRIETIESPSIASVDRVDAYWTSPSLPEVRFVVVDRRSFNPPRADTLSGSYSLYREIIMRQVEAENYDPARHDVLVLFVDSVDAAAEFFADSSGGGGPGGWEPLGLERLDATSWPVLRINRPARNLERVRLFYQPGNDQPPDARQRRFIAEFGF